MPPLPSSLPVARSEWSRRNQLEARGEVAFRPADVELERAIAREHEEPPVRLLERLTAFRRAERLEELERLPVVMDQDLGVVRHPFGDSFDPERRIPVFRRAV